MNVPWYRRRLPTGLSVVATLCLTAILTLLLVFCISPAEARTVRVRQFEYQLTQTHRPVGFQGNCWAWRDTWRQEDDLTGSTAYGFGMDFQYCARNGRIRSVMNYSCFRTGGYFNYDGCNRNRGATGHSQLTTTTRWQFHVWVGVRIERDPHAVVTFYPGGRVVGTVWYN